MAELPTELVLHIVSFLTREICLDPMRRLGYNSGLTKPEFVPDLPSVNALSRTNSIYHLTLNQTLYELCASIEPLGRLALLFAVEHNSENAFGKLVAAGISVDGKFAFKFGMCGLLHVAAGTGSHLIVPKLLRMYGAKTLASPRVFEHDYANGRSALDYAVSEGHVETVRLLAPKVAVFSSLTAAGLPIPDDLVHLHKQYLSKALLKSVSRAADIAICECLLSEGADVNTLDTGYRCLSPLGYATRNDDLATMQLLLGAGADPNLGDRQGVVPLFRAGSVPAAQALLDAGARLDATDNMWRNALMHGALQRTKLLRFLLERGVDPNQADDKGNTPLHYACWEPGVAAIELLLQFGATTVEKTDRTEVSPTKLAMAKIKVDAVRLLEPLVRDPSLKEKIVRWLEENRG
ncbi:ANK-REP-REGION domain-containing protein [Mycena sanguinolenta]|uniref:ANK-REP-REGION domain-containing protein n=1 Tax=Mycena sanguinolenta TaxID=230812 RepID=A0A8H6YX54_9AGAR|nr:ANK-REP-REGION domain-containing protein [Mycena sanguinolenta]